MSIMTHDRKTEIFRQHSLEETNRVLDRTLQEDTRPSAAPRRDLERYLASLEDAGFRQQVRIMQPLPELERRFDLLKFCELIYEELAGERLEVWRKFLPTTVSTENYVYHEPVTQAAAEEISWLRRNVPFRQAGATLEIWIPTGNSLRAQLSAAMPRYDWVKQELGPRTRSSGSRIMAEEVDPMAVLVVPGPSGKLHYFAIARWAEAELMSYEEIKSYVDKVSLKAETVMTWLVPTALFMAIGLVGFLMTAMTFGITTSPVFAFATVALGLPTLIWWISHRPRRVLRRR